MRRSRKTQLLQRSFRGALAALAALGAASLSACSDNGVTPSPDTGGPVVDGGPVADTGPTTGDASTPADAGDADPPALDLQPGPTCDQQDDPACAHPVNRILVPLLRGAGVPLDEAGAPEMCRRLAIDLVGRTPTDDELSKCIALPTAGRVDLFQAKPEYETLLKRRFAEILGYDVFLQWYAYIVEMDALVGQHAREELAYDQTIAELVLHPGFYSRHPGDDWTRAFFEVAFGREARDDEVKALRPLWIPWQPRFFCDGAIWYQLSQLGEDTADQNCFRLEYGVNPCACQVGFGYVGCNSAALGTEVDFGGADGCLNPNDFAGEENLYRTTTAAAGRPPRCPTGYPREACGDREYDFTTYMPMGLVTPLKDGTARRTQMVAQLSAALRGRDDFYEAAADRELRALLGWWQTGFRRPETDLPAVREVLVAELKGSNSLKSMQKMLLTSLLYTLPAERPAAAGVDPTQEPVALPPWTLGPSKFLAAESWLDSVGVSIGETLGACDVRFISSILNGADSYFVDNALLVPTPSTLGTQFSAQSYHDAAVSLGGCAADQVRPTVSSIGVVAAQRDLGQRLCAMGRAVLPDGLDGTAVPASGDDSGLGQVADHLYGRLLGRSAADAEKTALVGEMRSCLETGTASTGAGGAQACTNLETAGRWACQRLIDSAEFAIY
jgi:hypothetical protein